MDMILENRDKFIGKRVVITTIGNVSFSGEVLKITNELEEDGLFIRTDSRFGLCIWCPIKSVQEIIEIPINEISE